MVTEKQEEVPKKGARGAALTAAVRCTAVFRGVLEKVSSNVEDGSYKTGLSTLRGPVCAESTPIGVGPNF
jgi:hypothetical protein